MQCFEAKKLENIRMEGSRNIQADGVFYKFPLPNFQDSRPYLLARSHSVDVIEVDFVGLKSCMISKIPIKSFQASSTLGMRACPCLLGWIQYGPPVRCSWFCNAMCTRHFSCGPGRKPPVIRLTLTKVTGRGPDKFLALILACPEFH